MSAEKKWKAGANEVPCDALRMVAECQFADNGDNAKTAPVKMLARSGKPIEHWYWGRVVHDFSGMKHKPRIPIDYEHDTGEVLGYVNKFDTETGDLILSGAVIPFAEKDRASEILHKQKLGTPYEASIDFAGDGIKIQYVAAGEVAQVNGYGFDGPGTIIREWPLRGVAICPYGADSRTSTEFNRDNPNSTKCITIFSAQEPDMKTNPAEANANNPAVEADKNKKLAAEPPPAGAVDPAKTPAEGAAVTPPVEAKPDHTHFVAAFGDKGARWFLEGKTFQAATTEFVTALKTQHEQEVTALKDTHKKEVDRLTGEVSQLTKKLESASFGNPPVTFQAATADKNKPGDDPHADPNKLEAKVGPNIAKAARGIKLPQAQSAESE